MHFCAIHLLDLAAPPGCEEEVLVVVPDSGKTAIAVPLDALAAFLPLLEQVVGHADRPQCRGCGAAIPKLKEVVCPGSRCATPDPG